MEVPSGFVSDEAGQRILVSRVEHRDAVQRAGLLDPGRWEEMLRGGDGPGRSGTARLNLPQGPRVVLKRMSRGGWVGPLWRDRFPGASRLLANLTLPLEAARRGIPTASPVALLLLRAPPGLYRAWLAVEEIFGAQDLLGRIAGTPPLGTSEMGAVLSFVRRMHDAGLEHRDLNLGNLLVRERTPGAWEVFIVDLDRAILRDGPLPARARRVAVRRLLRSYVKNFGSDGPLLAASSFWHRLYAAGDEALERRLQAGRVATKVLLALHRIGWRARRQARSHRPGTG